MQDVVPCPDIILPAGGLLPVPKSFPMIRLARANFELGFGLQA